LQIFFSMLILEFRPFGVLLKEINGENRPALFVLIGLLDLVLLKSLGSEYRCSGYCVVEILRAGFK
jgi:hypothetical protein